MKDYLEIIDDIFKKCGMVPDPDPEPKAGGEGGHEDSPYLELNTLALRNLEKWVPDLNLYRCRRKVGRFASYEAVATWRDSNTGRPKEDRKLNLQISGAKGIIDFGTMQGYSPINLVMAALPCDRAAAIGWLQERLFQNTVSDATLDALVERAKANSDSTADDAAANAEAAPIDDDELARLVGPYWDYGDPLPEQIPMLIPHFVPTVGVGYLGGEWGTFKTFILNDMAVAIASGGKFAGEQAAERGCVIQLELEGSQNEARVTGAGTARGVEGALPIRVFTQMPPKILRLEQARDAGLEEMVQRREGFGRPHGQSSRHACPAIHDRPREQRGWLDG